ncbi:unnamed protein product [Pleuronectes platessa]|uniref:Uncharacterized protein n=1 Tax=Pleuronectes platessa TaxID=8262 RepID=A0A9N7U0M3_PLEPL|nr:unnamed protein product [Pleuronectes platessa]
MRDPTRSTRLQTTQPSGSQGHANLSTTIRIDVTVGLHGIAPRPPGGGDLVEEETGLHYEPQHPPQLEAAGVSWEASRGGTPGERRRSGREAKPAFGVSHERQPLLSSGSLGDVVGMLAPSVLHMAAHPGSSGDLAEKQSLRSG